MARKIDQSHKFKYNKGCKEIQLTHLSFADGLLILSHGDYSSVKVISDALNEFIASSGLKPNIGKSTIFFGSVDAGEKQRILDILHFSIGKLPVKYLAVNGWLQVQDGLCWK
ncbi:reverse transcriptase domain, Reverse transcriptase zinc-binding domain protein [Artemisia annua]|uniref:Reverse transcriptase domain, Reverse transcriptase zinc-binding domain protein n=1 Tax=Artemisia annua TaxID=35608 RepID=A0A2U1MVA3_ARTAN|nr:reverse transcriptase domain, Reverse transcriptase zinc-binding domain protein [Artemisia annua]